MLHVHLPRLVVAILILLAPSAVAQSSIEVITEDPSPIAADSIQFQPDAITISVAGQSRRLPSIALSSVKFKTSRKPASGNLTVQLRDGSRIRAQSLVGANGKFRCQSTASTFDLTSDQIDTCEFKKLNANQLEQWKSLLDSSDKADTLVLDRGEDSLDKITGVINGIKPDTVQFDYEGQVVDAPIAKLAGLKFFSRTPASDANIAALVRDTRQNTWFVTSIQSTDAGRCQLKLQCGALVDLPIAELMEVDYSKGNFLYLGAIEPLERQSKRRGDLGIEIPGQDALFGPRVVQPPAASPVTSPAIEFVGAGSITYRLPKGYSRLLGSVELSPEGELFTECRVSVLLENKKLWEHTFQQPRKSVPIDLAITGDQRLKLVVESLKEPPIGDVVLWKHIRLAR